MAVSLKEFNAIREYIQKDLLSECDNGGIQRIDIEEMTNNFTYEEWLSQYKPKREKVQNKQISEDVQRYFEEFWAVFPGTSQFTYNGKKFIGERVLKANKQVCLKLYNDVVLYSKDSGGTTRHNASVLLKALQVQVENIKIESYKSGQNRMQYMKSCEVYLRQKAHEPWLGQEMPEPIQTEPQSTDIDI